MVYVMTHLCTRCGCHFLGVNFQYVINGNLKVVTAAVEMTVRATSAEIPKTLIASIMKLNIHNQPIYILTIDKGSNIVKVGKPLQDALVDEEMSDSESDHPSPSDDSYKYSSYDDD